MSHLNNPQKTFPDEVLELREGGVPLPTWFSGPVYTGNGSSAAVAAVKEKRAAAEAPLTPAEVNAET
jgi:hypothetical protein